MVTDIVQRAIPAVFALVGFLMLCPGAASAQDTDTDAQALSLYRAGETAFHVGEYEAAFDLFQSSFDLSHRAALLHNMALAADRLRRDEEAASLYSEYLTRLPDAENRAEVEARLRALRQAIARHEQAPPVDGVAHTPDDQPPSGTTDVTSEAWFWPVVGGGVGLVAAGVIVGVVLGTQPADERYRTGDIGGVVFALRGTF